MEFWGTWLLAASLVAGLVHVAARALAVVEFKDILASPLGYLLALNAAIMVLLCAFLCKMTTRYVRHRREHRQRP